MQYASGPEQVFIFCSINIFCEHGWRTNVPFFFPLSSTPMFKDATYWLKFLLLAVDRYLSKERAPYSDDSYSTLGGWLKEQQKKVDKAKAMLQ